MEADILLADREEGERGLGLDVVHVTSARLLSGTDTWPHIHREPGKGGLADGQEEGEMEGCGGERSLEEVLNDNGVEYVSKLL